MTDNVGSSRTRQSSASSIMSGRKNNTYNALKMSSASGRYSVSGRSNQSLHMIARSEYSVVEPYGLPLPVLVNEALTFSEKNITVSVNFSNNGWAWAVYGRQLLVWQFKDKRFEGSSEVEHVRTPQRRRVISQCRELTLPHCDIGHKASLIAIFTSKGHQMPSCLAVSPTGAVRYWPSIAHDGSSVDCTGILEGQEFDYLFDARPQGYLLVTTTCSLVLLQLKIQNGMCNIHPRAIKIPSGFFGNIGRKFASIIIGMNTNQEKENKFVKVTGSQNEEGDWIISVLSDRWIQCWQFFKNGNEQLLFEDPDITRKVREEFQSKFWSGKENNQVMVYLLDMQESESNLFFLSGAVNTTYASQMHYALVVMHAEESVLRVEHFYPLKLNLFYNNSMEVENLYLKFILHRGIAYIYGDRTIYLVNYSNVTGNEYETEKPEFLALNDTIMNADICLNVPLFFTRTNGLVCITPSDFDPSEFINSSCSPDVFSPVSLTESISQTISSRNARGPWNLLMYELDPDELYNRSKEEICQLKAAFIYSLKRNTAMCNAILRDILPDDGIEQVDSKLDKIVITIAQDLAEDKPAADPRWEEKGSTKDYSLGSSTSVQILTQLREKEQALTHFLEFLHTVGIWEKLNASFYRGHVKATCHILSDISEKIAAAISLKNIQNSHAEIIDEAIRLVLAEWNECPTGNLVHQDLFYVKPTKFQDIYSALAKIPNKYIEMQRVEEIPKVLCEINDVLLTTLLEVLQCRERKMNFFALPPSKRNLFEYIPWTAESGKSGIKDTLLYLINITLKHGARQAGEVELKQRLYQQIVDLIDIVLDGRKNYLESTEDTEQYPIMLQQYHSQRRDLISTLVEDKQYELATKLAEKYLDFENLVVICDETQNQQRLDNYIEKFSDYNFSQIAIGWHLQQKKQGSLFDRFKRNQHALTQFLGDHPTLAWVQSIFNGNLEEAGNILFSLAQKEVDSVARKKTMLSLAKLSILVTNNNSIPSSIVEINSELALIEYQEEIPEFLLQSFGFNTDNIKVLKPEEIIHLYICEENQDANEFDFRKALELLNYTEDPFEVRHKIWCAAIQRDSWTNYDMNSPMDKIQNLLFFKLIDMCYLMDGELEDFLPPIENFLNSSELGDLSAEKSFQYLLKLVYEHISEYPNKNNVD